MSSDYRLAPALSARLLGVCLVLTALLVLTSTIIAAALDWSALIVGAVAVAGLAASFVLGGWLFRRPVVSLDEERYVVRMVRGVGVRSAAWTDVASLATSSPGGLPCLVLTLNDGRTTTIPVTVVDGDREALARDLREHLERGQGLRPLGR